MNRALFAVGFLSLLFFFIVVILNWTLGDGRRWAWGDLKDGDMAQHYAVGVLWSDGEREKLYRGYQLGEWINYWREGESTKADLERFNYVYSPLIALAASWCAVLPFEVWLQGWFWFSMACYAGSLWLLFRYLLPKRKQKRKKWEDLPLLVAAAGFPSFYYTLIPSQNTVLTLLLMCVAGVLMDRGREWLAGLVLGCAFYKPQILPYVAIFLLVAGHWRVVAGMVVGSVAWLALGVTLCGVEAYQLWTESLRTMMEGGQFVLQGLNQSWTGYFLSNFPNSPRQAAAIMAGGISLVIIVATARWARCCLDAKFEIRGKETDGDKLSWRPSYALFLAFTCYLVASAYVGHYEVLLGLPWWLVYVRRARCETLPRAQARLRWAQYGLIALFWTISLLSIVGLLTERCLSAPFLTLWLVGSAATAATGWGRLRQN